MLYCDMHENVFILQTPPNRTVIPIQTGRSSHWCRQAPGRYQQARLPLWARAAPMQTPSLWLVQPCCSYCPPSQLPRGPRLPEARICMSGTRPIAQHTRAARSVHGPRAHRCTRPPCMSPLLTLYSLILSYFACRISMFCDKNH